MATARNNSLLPMEALEQAAECLRTLAHPHRLRIVQMLLAGEYTVGELAEACGIASHVASEHLRLMKDRGLLGCERDGRCMYYHVAEDGLTSIMNCVEKRFG
ncbi:MAG: winged helix-turn-helix transcriptional regulator [Candidatus Omnitrophica bacterium]|nr:winged helix-turn-helix transcriptional regulator [Phycisphaerales bacterium]MCA9450961.1 winged helix-turn-helix transcriptional regulator [Candidatus Omnitrophota bacterium]